MAFYSQRFQGDPARDECPCPKKGMEKTIKCSIKDTLLFFRVASLGPFEAKIFVSYSLIGIVLYFVIFSRVFASATLNPGTSADQEQHNKVK